MQVGAEPENRCGGATVAETMDTAGSVRRLSWFDATVEVPWSLGPVRDDVQGGAILRVA